MQHPGECYLIADGRGTTPNLFQKGGLYLRAGAPSVAGQILTQSTAANGLAVQVTATLADELPPIYYNCTGAPGHYLPQDRIQWIHPMSGGQQCSSHIDTSATVVGDSETRPPSMFMTPYMCI